VVEVKLNANMKTSLSYVGNEAIPVLVIDNLIDEPESLIRWLAQEISQNRGFSTQASDFYPGVRKVSPANYVAAIPQLLPLLQQSFGNLSADIAKVVLSAFSITTTPVDKLRPIQMLPHFDTAADNQFAMVHYLCDEQHGGTSFYRHKKTGFETIGESRFAQYTGLLKQQAVAEKLHQQPHYIEGNSTLFEQIHSVNAQMNRMVIYPSNALHSGNIRPNMGLFSDIRTGRLTISSFVVLD